MTHTRACKTVARWLILSGTVLAIGSCNSKTPVEYGNPHDPLSQSYVPHKTLAPYDLRLDSLTDSDISISWQDSNRLITVQRMQDFFILERSMNGEPFSELAKLAGNTTSFVDHTPVDTLNVYRYRIRLASQYDTSFYSTPLVVQYTVVDAQVERTLILGYPVQSLALSRDGTMLAGVGVSMALLVWHVGDYTLVNDFWSAGGWIYSGVPYNVDFSPDGSLIAADADGTNYNRVNLWRIADRKTVNVIRGDYVTSFCFSSDGTKIITGGYGGWIRVWDIVTGSLLRELQAFTGSERYVNLLYSLRDGTRLMVGGYGVQFRRSDDLSLVNAYESYQSNYYTVSLDEEYLSFGGSIMSIADGSIVRSFNGLSGKSALTYDDRFLIVQKDDGGLEVGQVADGTTRLTKPLTLPEYTFPAVVCLPKSYEFLASSGLTGRIDLWVLKQGWTGE